MKIHIRVRKWQALFAGMLLGLITAGIASYLATNSIVVAALILASIAILLFPIAVLLRNRGQALGTLIRETKTVRTTVNKIAKELPKIQESRYQSTAAQHMTGTSNQVPTMNSFPTHLINAATPVQTPRTKNLSLETTESTKPLSGKEEVHAWGAARQRGQYTPQLGSSFWRSGLPTVREAPIAIIADEFTYQSFNVNANLVRINPNSWRDQFEKSNPAMLLCESTWQGGSGAPWQGKIYASVRLPIENRIILLEILDYCNKKGIPTVFWNKEDPTLFDSRINDFVRTAALFDYVLTSAEECIPRYENQTGVLHAGLLKFAVEPSIFNPVGRSAQNQTAVFAGSWYGNFRSRCDITETVLDTVLASGLNLEIFDRNYDSKELRVQFPAKYKKLLRPSISFAETAQQYRLNAFGVTINTVNDSETMFARRAYEIASSGAVILSNSSLGLSNEFGDSAIYVDKNHENLREMSQESYDKRQLSGMKIALRNTYLHRLEEIFDFVGFKYQSIVNIADVFIIAKSLSEAEAAIKAGNTQTSFKQVVVVIDFDCLLNEQSRLLSIADSNVTIITMRSIKEGYRLDCLIKSPFIYFANHVSDFNVDVAYLTGAMQFGEKAIHASTGQQERFKHRLVEELGGCMIHSEDLLSYLNDPWPILVYEV